MRLKPCDVTTADTSGPAPAELVARIVLAAVTPPAACRYTPPPDAAPAAPPGTGGKPGSGGLAAPPRPPVATLPAIVTLRSCSDAKSVAQMPAPSASPPRAPGERVVGSKLP